MAYNFYHTLKVISNRISGDNMNDKTDDPRRKFLIDALTYGVFGGVNTLGLMQASYALGDVPKKLPEGRSIYELKGQVRVDGQIATIETRISASSRVETGQNSQVIFVVGGDAFVLRSEGDLQMSGIGFLITGMRILTGKILSVFGERTKPHTITTLTATIGIRGTGIYIESDPEKTYACTCYGHTHIVALADSNISKEIVTTYHDEPVFILPAATGNKLIVPAPVINHTDTELSLIETLVGRTTPFGSGGYKLGKYD
ncbi:MAG: hypothetical protein ACI9KN_002032 [Gammaproteobacteria bacterium]|jgi:hypothetical protein